MYYAEVYMYLDLEHYFVFKCQLPLKTQRLHIQNFLLLKSPLPSCILHWRKNFLISLTQNNTVQWGKYLKTACKNVKILTMFCDSRVLVTIVFIELQYISKNIRT